MFERAAFKQWHLAEMLTQVSNRDAREFFATTDMDRLETLPSFTGFYKKRAVVSGGLIPMWQGRAYMWTIFDERCGRCFVPIFRGIKAFLEELRPKYNRLEICVPCEKPQAIRRALLLGFTLECERAVKYLPDGRDCALFAYLGGG